MYAKEEENYVRNIANMFDKSWNEVSLGENLISATIELCGDRSNELKSQISQQLFQAVHMQIR